MTPVPEDPATVSTAVLAVLGTARPTVSLVTSAIGALLLGGLPAS